jgi:hypothetical protein
MTLTPPRMNGNTSRFHPSMRIAGLLALAPFLALEGRAQTVQIDASIPYAAHGWNTVGYSGQVGWILADINLVGIEWTSFNSTVSNVYPVVGEVGVSHQIQTLQATYRLSLPLKKVIGSGVLDPFEVYGGVGAGLGRVRQSLPGTAAVVASEGTNLSAESTEFCCEVAAGIQFNLGTRLGVKAGYRYMDSVTNVRQFGSSVNTDAKVLEIGAVVRF